MDGYLRRGIDPKPNFVASNIHNGDDNVVTDNDALVTLSRQDQHRRPFLYSLLVASCRERSAGCSVCMSNFPAIAG
jgi:hypothetical protein